MEGSKLTYDEFKAISLKDIPEEQHSQWLTENAIEPAPFLPEGWMVIPKEKQLPGYRNLDDFQDYEHSREIE
ncbi:hypothetical protein AHMF7605_14680 [Adhaeribacter arboris]|uniref:Uncharacterized protein n=1 Tax=Adhaeribacter arboris TaxID=2072846 RepID=A0A2T2YGM8_9BACT|nr:hypothetical protein [Adhaeribacter arboris]PSR54665.1 hypothetical protein AHMF7605_14680 [Adhaeribacter arboris]